MDRSTKLKPAELSCSNPLLEQKQILIQIIRKSKIRLSVQGAYVPIKKQNVLCETFGH